MRSMLELAVLQYLESTDEPTRHARADERIDFDAVVTLQSDHNFYTGLDADVGTGGIFVATHRLHPVGTRLRVRFALPGLDGPVAADTEVKWVRDGRFSTLPPGMGLRFVSLPDGALRAVTEFVQQRDAIYYED